MESYVLSELGIADYGFGVPDPGADLSQPIGHFRQTSINDDRVNDYWIPIPPQDDQFLPQLRVYGPSGSMYLEKREYQKFQQMHLDGANNNSDFLSQDSFERLHTPPEGEDYAMGWTDESSELYEELNIPFGEPILGHNGSVITWSAFSVLLPNRNTSIFFAFNSESGVGLDVLEILLKRLQVIQ